jgi:hypothetical protein
MASKSQDLFLTIRSEGAILPPDLLQRIVAGDHELDGLKADDYHLPKGEKINEATSRAWNRLMGVWASFRAAAEKLADTDPGTSVTRERWLQPFFQELGYGRLLTTKAIEIDGKSYAISHGWNRTPIHLVGCHVDLDRSSQRISGAARSSPHSLLQEALNRSASHLWGFVTNGLQMRVLRNNASLTRQAFVEFDLEAMMLGENYADYVLLWLLCHQSRVEADNPHDCWLEKWSQAWKERGVRALDHLRRGVELAILALGRGFLSCPSNRQLRDHLRTASLDPQDYYRQLLRLVYRLLFLFAAEDRGLLLLPGEQHTPARARYLSYYSTSRLRRLAERRMGTRHTDLFAALRLVMIKLSTDAGCAELALPALGGFLFSTSALPDLEGCDIANFDLSEAIRALAVTVSNGVRRPVDYKNLGAEELGSVYESLLELHPQVNLDAATFELSVASGHERKTTGSYYTPTSLIDCLLDSALDPVLDEAARKPDAERAILALKVVDPACGSGHFLIAAAHRLAKRLASARSGDEEPSPEFRRTALRDIIGHCIYGVDINPMAVELCKVNLWMEGLEPGRPLSFLDHRIQCGNSLIGATPAQLASGIPDEAFEPSEGDDKKVCRRYKKLNQLERLGRQSFFDTNLRPWDQLGNVAASLAGLDDLPDNNIDSIHQKEKLYEEAVFSSGYLSGKFWADTWCAAFAWAKGSSITYAITEEVFRRIERNPYSVDSSTRLEIERLSGTYGFFHWHLAFPDVFALPGAAQVSPNPNTGWTGGFSVVLGNPPWVRYQTTTAVKKFLTNFKSYRSTADLSVFFLERSLNIATLGGRVSLLTPNKWFGAGYGEALREWLRSNARIHLIIDFGHSRTLFPDADTFPAAVVLSPVLEALPGSCQFRFVKAYDADRSETTLDDLVAKRFLVLPYANLRRDRWGLEDLEVTTLLDRLMSCGRPLAQVVGRDPAMGINSGLNDAYYIDDQERLRLIDEDGKSEPLIKRFIRGRDLRRWTSKWQHTWHIVLPSSLDKNWPWAELDSEAEAESMFSLAYPALHRHLKKYEELLRKRTARGKFWWELRSCDYYSDYEGPKLLVQGIAYYSQFAFDPEGYYINNMVAFIPSSDLYIVGILNSRAAWWLINHTFQPRKDGGRSLDIQHLLAMPIPDVEEDLKEEIRREVASAIELVRTDTSDRSKLSTVELRINALVETAFGLSNDELTILKRSLPARDPIAMLENVTRENVQVPQRDVTTVYQESADLKAVPTEPSAFPSVTVGHLSQFPAAAWATPDLVAPEHLALFALIDVIRAFNGAAKPGDVRAAAILVRNPAMALAFLDQPQAKQWVRVIGPQARPLPANVVSIAQFQKNATDLPWSNAMSQLTGSGALQTGADRWIAADNFPVSSGQDWVAGRAALAVELVSTVLAKEIEDRLTAFLGSVADGTASRAVS